MTDYPIYCPAQTYPQTRYFPAEFCENEVEGCGDLCAEHEEYDLADDADAWRKET